MRYNLSILKNSNYQTFRSNFCGNNHVKLNKKQENFWYRVFLSIYFWLLDLAAILWYWYWPSTSRHPGLTKWLGKSHYCELGVGWRYPGSKTEPCVKVIFRSYKTRQFITGTARTLISDYMGPNHKSRYCFTTHNAILCCVPGFFD